MTNYERIKTSVSSAAISNDDKKIVIDTFSEVPDESLVDIADLFEKKPEWIVIFNENRKKKIEAYQKADSALWQQILDEEKKCLEDLTFGLD